MHLRVILVGNQLDAQFLLWYVYLNSLRVLSNCVLILRRTIVLTLILLMWRIWWAPNNARRWQMGFNWALKGLTLRLLMSYIYIYMEHLFLMFLDHTQRRSTVGRTPLKEWSARRRDLYLTTHDTHNRQISMPPVGFEPTISAGSRSPAEIMGSNPTGGMDICPLWVSCVVR